MITNLYGIVKKNLEGAQIPHGSRIGNNSDDCMNQPNSLRSCRIPEVLRLQLHSGRKFSHGNFYGEVVKHEKKGFLTPPKNLILTLSL